MPSRTPAAPHPIEANRDGCSPEGISVDRNGFFQGTIQPGVRRRRQAKIGNQTDRLAHSPGKRPAELAGRFETRTAPMVTFGAGDTGAVVDLASG
jgi:hypothetical protein